MLVAVSSHHARISRSHLSHRCDAVSTCPPSKQASPVLVRHSFHSPDHGQHGQAYISHGPISLCLPLPLPTLLCLVFPSLPAFLAPFSRARQSGSICRHLQTSVASDQSTQFAPHFSGLVVPVKVLASQGHGERSTAHHVAVISNVVVSACGLAHQSTVESRPLDRSLSLRPKVRVNASVMCDDVGG